MAEKQIYEPDSLTVLRELEKKVLWLSTWMIHHANHVRDKRDGLKVGGHQASSASMASLMTALYFGVLKSQDRVAVKPHASPLFHAIQYLFGRQSRDQLERFRALGGAQSYPSRTKDIDDVDFSTGSVGLGVAMTGFSSLVQDYLIARDRLDNPGRMIAMVGDAEMDEGNVYEALLEGWKHDLRNTWWVIDYNRQSLDAIVTDRLFGRIDKLFHNMGWKVLPIKYGTLQQQAFDKTGGEALKQWIDDCSNDLYSALVFKGGAAWRETLRSDIGRCNGVKALLDDYDDDALGDVMCNLAGHDLESVTSAYREAALDETPTCIIAYTIKGFGLPLAGHKDNHAGMLNKEQFELFRTANGIEEGQEWDPYVGLSITPEALDKFIGGVPFATAAGRNYQAQRIEIPELKAPPQRSSSTQEGFGRIMASVARQKSEFAERIVTTSPDVTVSTNLGGWVNRRQIFDRKGKADQFREEEVSSAQTWNKSPRGQHIELGIAENNLFILLAALGLSAPLFNHRLLAVGTLYDPFIERGLDALNYACYQDARFMVVATPSGLSLAPEGGAHQSIATPMIGMAQPGLSSFEPAYTDELAVIMAWGFNHMQAEDGGAVYLRLSSRPLQQPERQLDDELRDDIVAGGYWLRKPAAPCDCAIVCSGAVTTEALGAWERGRQALPSLGLLVVTSADRLYQGFRDIHTAGGSDRRARSQVEKLLAPLSNDACLITIVDGHPASLSWLGSVAGHRCYPMGVDQFGQSGDIPDLFRTYGIDADSVLELLDRVVENRAASGAANGTEDGSPALQRTESFEIAAREIYSIVDLVNGQRDQRSINADHILLRAAAGALQHCLEKQGPDKTNALQAADDPAIACEITDGTESRILVMPNAANMGLAEIADEVNRFGGDEMSATFRPVVITRDPCHGHSVPLYRLSARPVDSDDWSLDGKQEGEARLLVKLTASGRMGPGKLPDRFPRLLQEYLESPLRMIL